MRPARPLLVLALSVLGACGRAPLDSPAIDVGSAQADAGTAAAERYRALAVATGRSHACALLDDHRVKCWGDNAFGQLGLGDSVARRTPADLGDHLPTIDLGSGRTAKALTASHYATCALLDDDSVKCWGWGALAVGRDDPRASANGLIGDGPGEMGDALAPIALGPGRTARLVALGSYDGCVVKDDESMRCWSANTPAVELPATPGRHVAQLASAGGVLARFDDGTVRKIGYGVEPPAAPIEGGAAVPALLVAGSEDAACVLWANGDSGCGGNVTPWWPASSAGDLTAVGVLSFGAITCGVLRDGHVTCPNAGTDAFWFVVDQATGFVRLGQPAVGISGGAAGVFCAVLQDGQVKCWSKDRADGDITAGTGDPTVAWPSIDLGTRDLGTRPAR
jgi:hypothetical protein